MLHDSPVRPREGDLPRRWIADDFFDLIVWYRPDASVHGFHLCYDKGRDERALTWLAGRGFSHSRIDPGDDLPTEHRSPVLLRGGTFPTALVTAEFRARSRTISPALRRLVLSRLREYRGIPSFLRIVGLAFAALLGVALARRYFSRSSPP